MITEKVPVIVGINPTKVEVQEIPVTCSFCAKQFETLEEIRYYTHPGCGCMAKGHEACLPKPATDQTGK